MPSPEEYRARAKETRKHADACRNQWERQALLTIADQCERIAAYKDLTERPMATALIRNELKEVGMNERLGAAGQLPRDQSLG